MTKEEKINWHEPSEERPYFLDISKTERIYVDKETYLDYMRPIWKDHKSNERKSRCQVAGVHGVKRCTENCSNCKYFRSGSNISLDKLYDEYKYEIADDAQDVLTRMINEEKEQKVREAIESLDEINKFIIIHYFYMEQSQEAISDLLGISQNAVSKRYRKSLMQLREKLKDYFEL